MLYRVVYKKIIIVVMYSFYLIDIIIIDKMYVFFWNKIIVDSYECFVKNVMGNKKFLKVFDIEILRILLFVIKVLLVEGVIDREVVEGIFIYIKCKVLEKKMVDDLNKDIIMY